MEIHHHHDFHHKSKKWKEYILESLMIFLAVTMGFFAEGYREHLLEQKREKQYIQTLIKDVETDTANLSVIISEYIMTKNKIYSILNNYDEFIKDFSLPEGRNYFSILFYHSDFYYTDRTMQQLKAGGMRLIKGSVSDSIMGYDAIVKYMFSQLDYNKDIYLQLIHVTNTMVRYQKAIAENKTKILPAMTIGNKDFWIKQNPELFDQLYNLLFIHSITNKYSIERMNYLKEQGSRLIHFLKYEYRIK